ncbi:fused MFS/spermidine synthase [Nocardioides sp. zg-1308]|uniref:Fused MFS/spermidine synthase n=1 Tax=Nocardioides renjunii TaxID=3095075 RepID=A0ABU5K985_9ACTN|nr:MULTISPECIES: fused MFS/spermidine synthase [unclassified Nocardioides]MDZ5661528.1 fused MFS/spermidine synthase [Nocardioides sp. S-58]NPD04634.1 fused MFS/spermidine synthase [Nocardioides sp. zg-1308]
MADAADESRAGLRAWAAAALVFGSSAAVLVVELVALRLLAPHYGLTLETNTLVIGLALTAIAAGTWAGGWTADRAEPRLLLGPLLGISGAAVALTPALVRGAAATDSPGLLLLASTATILVPGALLSAVTPVVIKLRLTTLRETGTVVGHLSGIGTVGAIFGTVLTGFVLISRVPVSGILVGLGVLLLATSVVVQASGRRGRGDVVLALVVVGAGLGAWAAPSGCDEETTYHCLAVVEDPERPTGRVLVLDGLRHSYVDLADATYLDFAYVEAMASVVDTAFPTGEPLDAYHLGAGGLTLPRYLAETRPGTTSRVSEIDAGVVDADVRLLGAAFPERTEVVVEDGRLAVDDLEPRSLDLVVGDAFGGVSVPWHLATVDAVEGLGRALDQDGVYVANLIDNPPLAFARAAVGTTGEVFDHVALLADPEVLAGDDGGNLVVVASHSPLEVEAVLGRIAERDLGWSALTGDDLAAWVGDAPVLTDDHAPVDQLLTPYDS